MVNVNVRSAAAPSLQLWNTYREPSPAGMPLPIAIRTCVPAGRSNTHGTRHSAPSTVTAVPATDAFSVRRPRPS